MITRLALALAAPLALAACGEPHVRQHEGGFEIVYHGGTEYTSLAERRFARFDGPPSVGEACYGSCTVILADPEVCTHAQTRWDIRFGHDIVTQFAAYRPDGSLHPAVIRQADAYARWPGLRERFLSRNVTQPDRLTGAELSAQHGVPLCVEGA